VREYEITIIVQPHLDDEARTELFERVNEWIAPGAEEEKKPVQNHWGQRQLAYPIRDFTEGYYLMYEALVDPSRISEIERNMQYAEDIIRYMVVRKGE